MIVCHLSFERVIRVNCQQIMNIVTRVIK